MPLTPRKWSPSCREGATLSESQAVVFAFPFAPFEQSSRERVLQSHSPPPERSSVEETAARIKLVCKRSPLRVRIHLPQHKHVLIDPHLGDRQRLEDLVELGDVLLVLLREELVGLGANVAPIALLDEDLGEFELVPLLRLEVRHGLVLVVEEGRDDLVVVDVPEEEGAGGSAVGRSGDFLRGDEGGVREASDDFASVFDGEEGESSELGAREPKSAYERQREEERGTHMLLVELAPRIEYPPTPDRVLPKPILNHRLDQAPLHPRSKLLIIDPPPRSSRTPHTLGLQERSRVPPPRLLHLAEPFARVGKDAADLKDEGSGFVGDGPGGAGWGRGKAFGEVGNAGDRSEVSYDFVERDRACKEWVGEWEKRRRRGQDERESESSMVWTSFSARSRMTPKTAATWTL